MDGMRWHDCETHTFLGLVFCVELSILGILISLPFL